MEPLATPIEKKQPASVRVVDAWGKKEPRRKEVDLGVSQVVLPPYTRKGVATYRSLNRDRIDPSTTMREVADPKTIVMSGTYKFYDKGEKDPTKKWKMMRNVRGPGEIVNDKVTGKQIIEDVIEPVTLVNGFLRVNIEMDYRLYVWMELHPLNGSNRNRPNDIAAVFSRTDLLTNKSLAYKNAEMDLGHEAESAVMKMKKDDIIGMATSCGIITYEHGGLRELSAIKIDLRTFARNNPLKYFSMSNNIEAAVRMNVHDAINFGLIEYIQDKKTFVVPEQDDEPLFTHIADEDPTESLIKYMLEPRAADKYQAVLNMIEYWK